MLARKRFRHPDARIGRTEADRYPAGGRSVRNADLGAIHDLELDMPSIKTNSVTHHEWCGTQGAGEFVDQFLSALFADQADEARTFLEPDYGRRSYGHIREALTFLEGENWIYIPTPGRTPDGCEIVRFMHLDHPSTSATTGKRGLLGFVDFEIRADEYRTIVRIGPQRWATSDLTE